MKRWKRGSAWLVVWILFLTAWLPLVPLLDAQGAVTFGALTYDEELVQLWDELADAAGMERTDLQNHYTSTYPFPKVIASVKQQTGFSPGGAWRDLEYRSVYCVSHSGEAANNPVSSMVCSSAWYAKEPWTFQNLPDYMRNSAAGDEYRLRFNFLMLAYGADYHAYQNGVNSSSIVGTADYYLCQGICTLTEDVQFTGNYTQDWGIYEPIVMDWASRFHPNGLGNAQVYEEMRANAEHVFSTVWHTAKLMAECIQSGEEGFTFQPSVSREADGMYHAKFPLTKETRPLLMASAIDVQGDWNYQFMNDALDFYSATGELPACGYLAKIDPQNANGIICASIGKESVRELHQPVQVRGKWSLTYSQANLVSALCPGTKIMIGTGREQENMSGPDFSSSGGVSRYTHTERWQADYIVNLRKFDAETGYPLEGAQFDILEAFDDSQLDGNILEDDNWDNAKGSQFLRWSGWDSPYDDSVVDPCRKDQEITDENGWLTEMGSSGAGPLHSNGIRAHHDVKYYSYTKGYCGGHPEPDPEDEEEMDAYEREIAVCEALERQGGFFHALDGGENLLREDRDRHYEAFVSLTYEYSARELTARSGYILHNQEMIHEPHENRYEGIHENTIPVETVTIYPSQYYALRRMKVMPEHGEDETSASDLSIQREAQVPLASWMDWEFDPDIIDEDAWFEETDDIATDSDAEILLATVSDATISNAVPLPAEILLPGQIIPLERSYGGSGMISMLSDSMRQREQTYEGSVSHSTSASRASRVAPIPVGNTDYGGVGAAWTFEVYDYRTEGELHANKRDQSLKAGEQETYDSYRDTQGDATLEGAVYGLFAAEDIVHPDGKTGIVYQKGNLTSVAVTNQNGDFSFSYYTQKPGVIYDYETGEFVFSDFHGPTNLYMGDYEKYSSNEDSIDGKRWHYEIENLEEKNGNCWIGRPLILGAYYVQELVRSEGYELSIYGINEAITNRSAWLNKGDLEAKGTVRLVSMEEQIWNDSEEDLPYMATQLTFESRDTINGYDIQISGIDPDTVPSFYVTTSGTKDVYSEWLDEVVSYEPVEAEPGTKVLIHGAGVKANVGDWIELPDGEQIFAEHTILEPVNSDKIVLTGSKGAIPTFDIRYLPELTGIASGSETEFIEACNAAFSEIGLLPMGTDAPYLLIPLGGDMTNWHRNLYQYLNSDQCPAFNAAWLETITVREDVPCAVLRYSFLKDGEVQPIVYSASDDAFYVKYDVRYSEATEGYLYRKIAASDLAPEDYEIGNRLYRWIQIAREKPEKEMVELYENLELIEFVSAQEFVSYWAYGVGDYLRNEDGSIYQKEVISYEEKSGYSVEQTFYHVPIEFTYDPDGKSYKRHISPEQIPEDGKLMLSIRYEDVYAGNRIGLSAYAVPSMDVAGTYIQPVVLAYPGQEQVYEDCGTRTEPVLVLERIISEKVKLTKTIEESSSRIHTADGFRFKIYLKSNLERLYRDESGNVVWMNREEEELSGEEILKELKHYPEKVPKIMTKKVGDGIEDHTYARILEQDENGYNYDKFFDAIRVADHDIWDDAEPTVTSLRPIGNVPNRTEFTLENKKISDAVRQFAIDWYLEDQVSQLSVEADYSDELYDQALYQASVQALDYLTPFFRYDLDTIYAVLWDSEEQGGADEDTSTLSVDMRSETYYYGVSCYLPYGTYIIVEQQPQYARFGDLKNKGFQIESPKEIMVPTEQKDYDERYLHKNVPWSVVDPGISGEEQGNSYRGYAYRKFYNPVYSAKLRIEKLDAVTHENLLHDDAVFRIYKGKRNENPYGDGEALFYEEPTLICGSREFLEAMKAKHIQPMRRGQSLWVQWMGNAAGPGVLFTGIVAAGTPICEESDQVVMNEDLSKEAEWIYSYSTERESRNPDIEPETQNVGYLETPQTLDAGVYVICEIKPPDGYVRTDPIALELYSDKVAYYKEGNPNERVFAAIYEYVQNEQTEQIARIYVENEPITLQVEKRKEAGTITYKIDGRIEGSLAKIGNDPDYVYAYDHGDYLGYAWKKGTLMYLQSRRAAGEEVEIVYDGSNFAGYGYITRTLETEENPYAVNALMTLYQALELYPSGDTEDAYYEGLEIERNVVNDVVRIYVKDTNEDILYYDLNNLLLRRTGQGMYAFRSGIPYLEFYGGDLEKVEYDRKNRRLIVGKETLIYHLDRDGYRDSLVDPNTGMAYIKPENAEYTDSVFVWPVHIHKDEFGNVISKDKIHTSRIAAMGEQQEFEYITGSWNGQGDSVSHRLTTVYKTADEKNLNQEAVINQNNGNFDKFMNPIYDRYGLVSYYSVSKDTYEEGTNLWDRNGDFIRYFESDYFENYKKASYQSGKEQKLPDESKKSTYHRYGESYILENTWISSDRTPNDPFRLELTDGCADILKRVSKGIYIIEELQPPEGYGKGFPVGVRVQEQIEIQEICMTDPRIKAEFSKIDSPEHYEHRILDMMHGGVVKGKIVTGLGEYSHHAVSGAELALVSGEDVCGSWTTGENSVYLEEIPMGTYTLKELTVPNGFVRKEPMEIRITSMPQVQTFMVNNDHTRIEVEKYAWENRKKQKIGGAEFGLYPAILDSGGQICCEEGQPLYDRAHILNRWTSSNCQMYRDFIPEFENMYRTYGTMPGTVVCWSSEGENYRAEFVCADVSERDTKHPTSSVLVFRTDQGKDIRITIYEKQEKRLGTDFVFEYQFEYEKLPQVNAYACAWQTVEGIYRMDYLPTDAVYVLVEIHAPDGFLRSPDHVVQVADTADIQRYSIENIRIESGQTEPPEEPTEPESPTEPPKEPTEPESSTESPEKPTEPESPTESPEKPTEPGRPERLPEESNVAEHSENSAGEENLQISGLSDAGDQQILELPIVSRKIGYISASYVPKQSGSWRSIDDHGIRWLKFLPRLGDRSDKGYWLILFIISTLGVLLCRKRKNQKD